MRWFVSVNGKADGPMEQDALVAAIGRGEIERSAQVCREGTRDWVEAGSLLKVPAAQAANPPRPVRPGGPWMIAVSVASTLVLAATGALIWRVVTLEESERTHATEQETRLGRIEEQLQNANGIGTWVGAEGVPHTCYSDRTNVTCTFTNVSDRDVQTCTRALLRQKEATGIKLESMIICTGRLRPGETRNVVGPWVGGFADDICYSEKPYVGKLLDWSKCTFSSEPFDLPRARKVNAAVATAVGG